LGETIAGLIEKNTGIETRSAVIGHIQRGGSPTLLTASWGPGWEPRQQIWSRGEFGKMVALRGNDVIAVSLEEATPSSKLSPELAEIGRYLL